MKNVLRAGQVPLHNPVKPVRGEWVVLDGEDFYRLVNYDSLRPFLMSIVSGTDHWMFISSTGALTAGRGNPDSALFPYYTEDKIHDSAEVTGSKTIVIVKRQGRSHLWEPFSARYRGVYRIERHLYKNACGNSLIFEETNADLGLSFRYRWSSSERFGFVRRSRLANLERGTVSIRLLDGLQNLMPCGSSSQFQLEKGNLLNAYKKSELVPETGLGLFRLSSIPIDRPEPAEALRVTTAFSLGPGRTVKLLSSTQLEAFRRDLPVRQELEVRAERGAYLLHSGFALQAERAREWCIVADVNRGPSDVARLNHLLRNPAQLEKRISDDVARGTADLIQLGAGADGLQKTARPLSDARHFNNVLFNIMRGGIFPRGYKIKPSDLQASVQHANHALATKHARVFRRLESLHEEASPHAGLTYSGALAVAVETRDPNLERLFREYLPLTFSRRHGDPSRPWNRFSIAARNPDGTRPIHYEGNWRDIFQNWEALAISFPGYTSGMICKFVNASTPDGYNPYRVTSQGFDWEVEDPSDPWAHIGYWGDHQVIYFLKLLEILQHHEPATLRKFLTWPIFSYANVPYRIKPYAELVADPKDTVVFDQAAEDLVQRRVKQVGTDGKLVWDRRGRVWLVNLTEKILVSFLAKFSNFVPEAGIWLNTQRPEWNDANNALVGNGASMVTLFYLRRFLAFNIEVFESLRGTKISLSEEVAQFLAAVARILAGGPVRRINDQRRRSMLDALGNAGTTYRQQIYSRGFSCRVESVSGDEVLEFFRHALEWVDASIRANRRADGLYHAYNLIQFDHPRKIRIRRLYEMLEGQVAILSSGYLSPEESLRLLTALRNSPMYRADQRSYLLYPDRKLPKFLEKNNLPAAALARSRLLRRLLKEGDQRLVERDADGKVHFNGGITNSGDVCRILERLARDGYARLVAREKALVLRLFEELFDHQSFTGRSGTFFGYEGLGCIYWHMVSKLLLAAQESHFRAVEAGAAKEILEKLAACYEEIRSGIGERKPPEVYGAFPMDPYSHTPGDGGARQPGLTGQVKEDVLARVGELGVIVHEGQIHFRPMLLKPEEFLTAPAQFQYYDSSGKLCRLRLPVGSLGFTYCQVPIVYRLGKQNSVEVLRNHSALVVDELGPELSHAVFNRTNEITRIVVSFARMRV